MADHQRRAGLLSCVLALALVQGHALSVEVTLILEKVTLGTGGVPTKCTTRYGGQNTTWEDMPLSSGRIASKIEGDGTVKDLAYRIVAKEDTAVMLQCSSNLYPLVYGTTAVGDGDRVVNVPLMSKNAAVGVAVLRLEKGNTLAKHGRTESMAWEPPNPIAPQKAVKVTDITAAGPMILGTAPLPENLQGLWWLTHQGASSALVSFGGPNDDGGGCNTGFLVGPANETKVRVQGARSFSTAQPTASDIALEAFDAVYKFSFNSAVNPTAGKIYSESVTGIKYSGPSTAFLSDFTMTYLPKGHVDYPGSKVWLRKTSFLGMNAGHDYYLVQVMTGNGTFIQPTWNKFVAYMNSAETGWTPGWMFYKSKYPSPSVGAPAEVAKVQKKIHRRLILGIVAGVIGLLCCCCCLIALCVYCFNQKGNKRGTDSRAFDDDDYEGVE